MVLKYQSWWGSGASQVPGIGPRQRPAVLSSAPRCWSSLCWKVGVGCRSLYKYQRITTKQWDKDIIVPRHDYFVCVCTYLTAVPRQHMKLKSSQVVFLKTWHIKAETAVVQKGQMKEKSIRKLVYFQTETHTLYAGGQTLISNMAWFFKHCWYGPKSKTTK